jgi:cellobiose-specific phosphotransferase system component IIA
MVVEHVKTRKTRKIRKSQKAGTKSELFAAIRSKNMAGVKEALEYGADPNVVKPDDQNTPLIEAVHTDEPELVQILIDAGAQVDAKGSEGGTALYWAADNMPLTDATTPTAVKINKIIKILLKSGANPQLVYDSLAKYPAALEEAKKKILRAQNQTIAIEVGVKKDLPPFLPGMIRGFLGGANPADKELFTAIEFQSVEGVKAALSHGADPNAVNPEDDNKMVSEYAFDIIDREISREMIKALMKSGLSLTRKSEFSENIPLINAVHKGDVQLVQMMIDAGSPVDAKGSEGGTALYWAADNMPLDTARAWPGAAERHQTIMKILLKAGANPQLVYDALEKYPEALAETKMKIERIRNPKMAIEVGVKKDLPTPLPGMIRGFLGATRRRTSQRTRRRQTRRSRR